MSSWVYSESEWINSILLVLTKWKCSEWFSIVLLKFRFALSISFGSYSSDDNLASIYFANFVNSTTSVFVQIYQVGLNCSKCNVGEWLCICCISSVMMVKNNIVGGVAWTVVVCFFCYQLLRGERSKLCIAFFQCRSSDLSSAENVSQIVNFSHVLLALEYLTTLLQKLHFFGSTNRPWELSELCCSFLIFPSGEELSWSALASNFSKSPGNMNSDLHVLWYHSLGTSFWSNFQNFLMFSLFCSIQ